MSAGANSATYLRSTAGATNELVGWVYSKITQALQLAKDDVNNMMIEHKPFVAMMLDTYYTGANYLRKFTDRFTMERISDKFAPVFRTTDVKNKDGVTKKVKTLRLWWDITDSETKRAIESGEIHENRTKAEEIVRYGKWVSETIKGNLIKVAEHRIKNSEAVLWGNYYDYTAWP